MVSAVKIHLEIPDNTPEGQQVIEWLKTLPPRGKSWTIVKILTGYINDGKAGGGIELAAKVKAQEPVDKQKGEVPDTDVDAILAGLMRF